MAPPPSADEEYCAWYGDADDSTLYAGLSPFWSAMRAAGGDPTADLATPGPQWVGRFDLASETWSEPLVVGGPGARAGVWDVHVSGAQLFFTTFYEGAGRVDLATGTVARFSGSKGLNEIEAGPDGTLLVSRYGSGEAGPGHGELVLLAADGGIRERIALDAPPGLLAAPKTPAWDPARGLFWATNDFVFTDGGASPRRDAYRISRASRSIERQAEPELQFVRFDPAGRGWLAEVDGEDRLWLRTLSPGDPPEGGRRSLLDPAFPGALDFVQDMKQAGDRIVLTRWSGIVHVVTRDGEVRTVQLPKLQPGGLYYTAVLHGERLCATYCGPVAVVCTDAP